MDAFFRFITLYQFILYALFSKVEMMMRGVVPSKVTHVPTLSVNAMPL
jgi:hypothetical protein